MSYKIDEIEGIGPTFAEKLVAAEINTTDDLLKLCCDKKGREGISGKTGISEKHLLKWANMADLMRVSGVGRQFAELLEASGVDTIKELRHRRADNLSAKMKEVNDSKNLAKASPAESMVSEWIEQAKKIDPTITH